MSAVLSPTTDKPQASFVDHAHPTITFETGESAIFGWPLHMLMHWAYRPHSPEDVEALKLVFSDGSFVTVFGSSLDEIIRALNAGKGGAIRAQRDVGLEDNAAAGRAFVRDIDLHPANSIN